MKEVILVIVFIILGIGVKIFIDVYRAGVRRFKEFDWKKYWYNNQMRLIGFSIGGIVLGVLAILLKDWLASVINGWIDALVAAGISIGTGAGTQYATKKMTPKGSTPLSSKPSIVSIIEKYILQGLSEFAGDKDNPVIVAWARKRGFKNFKDSMGWCAIGMGNAIEESGRVPLNTAKAADYMNYGRPGTIEEKGTGNLIAVFEHHVAAVDPIEGEKNGKIFCVGFNQSNTTNKVWMPKKAAGNNFLGYRMPLD